MIIGVVIIFVKVMLSFTERIISVDELKRSTNRGYMIMKKSLKLSPVIVEHVTVTNFRAAVLII